MALAGSDTRPPTMPTEGEGSSNAEGADMRKTDIERVLRQEPNAVFEMAHGYWLPGVPKQTGFVIEKLETTEYTNYYGGKIRKTRAIGTQIQFRTKTTDGGYLRYEMTEQRSFSCDVKDIGWERLEQVNETEWRPLTRDEWVSDTMHRLDSKCREHDAKQKEKNDLVYRWEALGVLSEGSVYGDFVSLPATFQKLLIRLTEVAERQEVRS